MTLSVVIPALRADTYLIEAVQSCLDSDFTNENCEILVVCPDNQVTPISDALAWLPDGPIKVLAQEGRGISGALNTGIRAARGEFIARMDADDIVASDRFRLQVAFLRNNPRVVVVGGQVRYVCQHGSILGSSNYPSRVPSLPWWRPARPLVAHPATMFRKCHVDTAGYDELFFAAEDQELWTRLLAIGPFANLPEIVLDYRQHSNQASNLHASSLDALCFHALLMHCLPVNKRAIFRENFPSSSADLLDIAAQWGSIRAQLPARWVPHMTFVKNLFVTQNFLVKWGGSGGLGNLGSKETRRVATQLIGQLVRSPISSFFLILKIGAQSLGAKMQVLDCGCLKINDGK